MTEAARHDVWQAGENYEVYMGRWSRAVAPLFLDWVGADRNRDWLDLGCGTGALSAAILARCDPKSVVALDLSDTFVARARESVIDARVEFRVGSAEPLDLPSASRDAVVSGLLLNFLPDRAKALTEARRVTRSGGLVAFYVWDYPGGGLEFVDAFWKAAARLEPRAGQLDEARRFPFCTPEGLSRLVEDADLGSPEWTAIEVPTVFRSFEDFWRPFTLGAGPAPGYCSSLGPDERQRLEDDLREGLARGDDGTIPMNARAWAVRALVP